jgi:hypothetical protein
MNVLPAAGRHTAPIWGPDDRDITYASALSGPNQLYTARADGSGAPKKVVADDQHLEAATWTADGRQLLYYKVGPNSIWVLDVMGDGAPRRIQEIPAPSGGVDVSPNGRWVAYDHAGFNDRPEVFVQPYQGTGERHQISTDGGKSPVWRADGRELFYLQPAAIGNAAITARSTLQVMAVQVEAADTFKFGAATPLFKGQFDVNHPERSYDVSADGQRFLLLRSNERPADGITGLEVVLNWFEELKRLAPTN